MEQYLFEHFISGVRTTLCDGNDQNRHHRGHGIHRQRAGSHPVHASGRRDRSHDLPSERRRQGGRRPPVPQRIRRHRLHREDLRHEGPRPRLRRDTPWCGHERGADAPRPGDQGNRPVGRLQDARCLRVREVVRTHPHRCRQPAEGGLRSARVLPRRDSRCRPGRQPRVLCNINNTGMRPAAQVGDGGGGCCRHSPLSPPPHLVPLRQPVLESRALPERRDRA